MKKPYFLFILGIIAITGCGSNPTANSNANNIGNLATIENSNLQNTNLSKANNILTNSSNSNISTNISTTSEITPQSNPELLKQIEDQQKETSDIRKAANAASNEKPKSVGKPPAGAPKPY